MHELHDHIKRVVRQTVALTIMIVVTPVTGYCQAAPPLHINWNKIVSESRSTATFQVVVNPMLRKGSPIYEPSFDAIRRSEEHTSELQSLMRISYAVFCLK